VIEKKVNYFGTEIQGEKFLKRRYKVRGMFLRGNGTLRIGKNINFRYLGLKREFTISMKEVYKVDISNKCAGRIIFQKKVLRIYWRHQSKELISGFRISTDVQYVKHLIQEQIDNSEHNKIS
jgi:hypothetical protein